VTSYIAGLQRSPDSTLITLHGPDMRRLTLRVVERPGMLLSLGDSIACDGETFAGAESVAWTRRANPKGEEPAVDVMLEVVTA
jgi:hypothetical protein